MCQLLFLSKHCFFLFYSKFFILIPFVSNLKDNKRVFIWSPSLCSSIQICTLHCNSGRKFVPFFIVKRLALKLCWAQLDRLGQVKICTNVFLFYLYSIFHTRIMTTNCGIALAGIQHMVPICLTTMTCNLRNIRFLVEILDYHIEPFFRFFVLFVNMIKQNLGVVLFTRFNVLSFPSVKNCIHL